MFLVIPQQSHISLQMVMIWLIWYGWYDFVWRRTGRTFFFRIVELIALQGLVSSMMQCCGVCHGASSFHYQTLPHEGSWWATWPGKWWTVQQSFPVGCLLFVLVIFWQIWWYFVVTSCGTAAFKFNSLCDFMSLQSGTGQAGIMEHLPSHTLKDIWHTSWL